MQYWRYSVPDPEPFNKALLRDIEIAKSDRPDSSADPNRGSHHADSHHNHGIYKQPVSVFDGYNHELSYNANFPEFQCNYRSYNRDPGSKDYNYYDSPDMCYRADQMYKITLWTKLADLFHDHARAVAVPNESFMNYKITVKSMWFHEMHQGDYDNWHNHPGVQWISIYYVDVDPLEGTEYMMPTGDSFLPVVRPGDLIIAPSFQLHRSMPKVQAGTKTVIAINWEIGSKYTTEAIDRLKQSHPQNFYPDNSDPETRPYIKGRMPAPEIIK